MRVISMYLGDREIARIEEGVLKRLVEFNGEFVPNLADWYDECFYGIRKASTFDQRFKLVEENNYFCYTKPQLQLIAKELPDRDDPPIKGEHLA